MNSGSNIEFNRALIDRWFQPSHPHVWLLNTADTGLARSWQEGGTVLRHTHLTAGAHQAHEALGIPSVLPGSNETVEHNAPVPWDIVWQWPKSKPLAAMLAHWLSGQVAADSRLWVVGPNRGGIRSVPGILQPLGWHIQKVGSMRRQSLYLATRTSELAPTFDLSDYWSTYDLPDSGAPVVSLPGVFSHGRIDPGTRALLPWLKRAGMGGSVLDFGCGAGVISLALAQSCPAINTITSLDHDWLAVSSARKTAATNGLLWNTVWSDHLAALNERFDAIVTNPPFHEGLQVQYETTHRLLAEARHYGRPEAHFLAVVNQHLPYGDWLRTYLDNPECLERTGAYAIWQGVIRP